MARENKNSMEAINDEVGINAIGLHRASIEISGTFVGTVQFEGSAHPEGPWQSIQSEKSMAGGAAATSVTAPATHLFDVRGISRLRARCSAYTSGTINAGLFAE